MLDNAAYYILYKTWCVSGESVFFCIHTNEIRRIVDKKCENFLLYACKKGVPMIKGVRNSSFSLRVSQEYTVLRSGS